MKKFGTFLFGPFATHATTAYDPTCGSGSLLLQVAAQAGKHITLEGQEKDERSAAQQGAPADG